MQLPHRRVDRRGELGNVLADQDQLCRDQARDAREEIWRRAVVDRHHDNAAEQAAPEGDDPFRTVLAPEDDFVAFAHAELVKARGEARARYARLPVRVAAAAEPVVVDEELAARQREVAEKVNERVTDHE